MITEEKSNLRKIGGTLIKGLFGFGAIAGTLYLFADSVSRTNDAIYVDSRSCFADTEREEERIFRMNESYCLRYRDDQR
jgi:hypothetical protein|tara:strand:- start:4182 stop:4418 length:237 start_codon:yes stop_codon:yes gene_type:complete